MSNNYFRFKQFTVEHTRCAMKVGTDGVLLGAWARGGDTILDIGTGSGLIALFMAQRYPSGRLLPLTLMPVLSYKRVSMYIILHSATG